MMTKAAALAALRPSRRQRREQGGGKHLSFQAALRVGRTALNLGFIIIYGNVAYYFFIFFG